jgi:SNF2 family DNA or RNA helicase
MDIIEELTEVGEQVVVFSSQYNGPLREIMMRCTDILEIPAGMIAGATKDVDDLCEKFRQGEIKVLCINAKSGGEGLNLQKSESWPGGASHVVMLDKWWNPKFNEQAIARVYRTGQTDVVTIHELFATNTVDAYIEQILDDKTMMIDSIMEVKEMRKGKKDWKESLKDVI